MEPRVATAARMHRISQLCPGCEWHNGINAGLQPSRSLCTLECGEIRECSHVGWRGRRRRGRYAPGWIERRRGKGSQGQRGANGIGDTAVPGHGCAAQGAPAELRDAGGRGERRHR